MNIYPAWVSPLVDFFFPPLCPGCGEVVDNYPALCQNCDRRIDRMQDILCLHCFNFYRNEGNGKRCCETPLPLLVFATYNQPYDEIIKQFKFRGITFPALQAVDAIVAAWQQAIVQTGAEAFVPVPLHLRREKWRGFNQAVVIANELSRHTNIPVASDLLYRQHARQPQSKLTLEQRGTNISGAFVAEAYTGIPTRVILVDDVITTGLTMKEAAKACNAIDVEVVGAVGMAVSSYAIAV